MPADLPRQTYLTGITTTGTPHLGNYVGAIRPAIRSSQSTEHNAYFFLADLHALVKCQEPEKVHQSSREIAATWLALGLNTDNVVFYRQSDIPEIPQLAWFLNCVCAKGLLNRAHAYKDTVAKNQSEGEDADFGITLGLFSYPVLMAADILMFNGSKVPVGKDQIQHLEMARDIAKRFNYLFGEHFVLPEAVVDDNIAVLQGLDGRKMSKSYGNTIPLFLPEKKLKKQINKIKTNLLEPGEPKDPDSSTVFQLWEAFATPEQTAYMREEFAKGIAWGEVKKQLFALLNNELGEARERYNQLLDTPDHIEQVLQQGAKKARAYSEPFYERLKTSVGIHSLIGK